MNQIELQKKLYEQELNKLINSEEFKTLPLYEKLYRQLQIKNKYKIK